MRFSEKSKDPVNTIIVNNATTENSRTFKTLDPVTRDCLIEIIDYYVDTFNPVSVADLSVTVNGNLMPRNAYT